MDSHFSEYFREFCDDGSTGTFHCIIPLHKAPDIAWRSISAQVPTLSKAWFELAQLTTEDRIEFLHQFWESKMIYHRHLSEFLDIFFGSLDDLGIFITQKKYDDPFVPQIVYSIRDNGGFYRGSPPATDEQITNLQNLFPNVILPSDFLTFLQIHNGFYKTTDSTGIMTTETMRANYEEFQGFFAENDFIYTQDKKPIDPKKLYPFYKSFGMPYYHCFWAEWYPENEMGVVYYSSDTKTVSDVSDEGVTMEHLCFPTFTDWLMFYLERITT